MVVVSIRTYAEQDYSRSKRGLYAIIRGAQRDMYHLVEVFERYQDGTVWAKKVAIFDGSLQECQEFLDRIEEFDFILEEQKQ